MILIKKVAQLKPYLTDGGRIEREASLLEGEADTIKIIGGTLTLYNASVLGMELQFEGCDVLCTASSEFYNCTLTFLGKTVRGANFSNCKLTFYNNRLRDVRALRGEVTLRGTNIPTGVIIHPEVINGPASEVLALMDDDTSYISNTAVVKSASVTISNFGTYNGNVHYFKEQDMVIAGCWKGPLSEFKGKAVRRGVSQDRYEAVYNYFKSFN